MATDLMTEVFVAVEGYEGIYEVSNLAHVKSLDRTIQSKNRTYQHKGRILRARKNTKGYWQVPLCKNGKTAYKLLHRLVAQGFLVQPEGCNIVNHLDCDKDHNWSDNLEYTTARGNMQHAKEKNRLFTRPVIRSDGKIYHKLSDVKEDGFKPSSVCQCCRGKQKTHKGYQWRYLERMEAGTNVC